LSSDESFCTIIADDLPSECTCIDATYGGTIDCQEDIILDTIGVKAEFLPCATEAHISLTIYETAIGFSYNVGSIGAGTSIDEPIPGLSIGLPGIADAGIYADASVSGNLDALTVTLGLNACAEVAGEKECGSSIYSGLPVPVISGTWDFGSICSGPSPGPGPSPPPPGPSPSGNKQCLKCINNDEVWCWEDAECHEVGSVFDPCSDSDCVSTSSLSSCDLHTCVKPNIIPVPSLTHASVSAASKIS
jgi:hypothetical protein